MNELGRKEVDDKEIFMSVSMDLNSIFASLELDVNRKETHVWMNQGLWALIICLRWFLASPVRQHSEQYLSNEGTWGAGGENFFLYKMQSRIV